MKNKSIHISIVKMAIFSITFPSLLNVLAAYHVMSSWWRHFIPKTYRWFNNYGWSM